MSVSHAGHKLSKKALGKIVKKYCGKAANLTMDDFVMCAVKITSTQGDDLRSHCRLQL